MFSELDVTCLDTEMHKESRLTADELLEGGVFSVMQREVI
jgi:hypothetical protein